ncbi:D-glycerate dehydrogenase [Bacillus sp. FJAT-49732]|uniref:D-glycerate dehydrogenase n=1 Tax=Lederbergia citrisecunda TaxID=2833583 RepID=A0A942TJE8_9BACI|nr:D-glycerate dehydrogenase [Lederbergia citrisecunda]
MKPKIYATLPIPTDVEKYLSEYCEVRKWTGEDRISRDLLLEEIKGVDGLLTSGIRIDEDLLKSAPNLKVVSNVSVGFNNFNVEAMKKYNVIGTNTPYVLDETVADLTFALILSSARRIAELDRLVKDGNWNPTKDDQVFYGLDVHSTTLGIIGMGRIGEAVARRAKFGFNMDVLYYNRNRKLEAEEKYGAEHCDLDSLLQKSDFIVLLTPLTPETEHLIGEREFKIMKKSAFFINVSRGKTVDEAAMIRALENKEIYGAGLDVYQKEPVEKDNPLLKMPNVVTIPHIGSATEKTRDSMMQRAAQNIVSVLTGTGSADSVY